MSTAETKKIVEKYAQKLRKNKIPFSRMYLFGSFSRNEARKESDIDVAIVSRQKETDELIGEIGFATIGVDTRIEPHIFSEKDFKSVATPIIAEILKTGIKVA